MRGKPPASITGQGEDELTALTDLAIRLREYGHPDHMAALERRARQAFHSGAEEHSRHEVRRPLESPDRLDACVWGFSELMLGPQIVGPISLVA